MEIINIILSVVAAIVVFVVTAANARKAGSGSGRVWAGGILLTLYLLSMPMSLLVTWTAYRVTYSNGYNPSLNALGAVAYFLGLAVAWAFLITGVILLISGAKKAARGPRPMPPQPYGYPAAGGYPQQPMPPAPGMAPPPRPY